MTRAALIAIIYAYYVFYPRDNLKRTQTPQGFTIGKVCDLHRRALEAGITNSVASCTLMIEMGEQVYFSSGSEKNIKLTTVEDIVLNSAGNQMRSYTYLADSASAILSVLTSGESCNAYNIANSASRTTIVGYAKEVAAQTGTKVIFADSDEVAKAEMTPIAKQVLSSKKLEGLGWKGQFTVEEGIRHTLDIMRELD